MGKRKLGKDSTNSPRSAKKVNSERCVYEGCKCSATFGLPATRERKWCSKHKAAGAINLRTKLCEACDDGVLCTKQATFGYASDRRKRWCATHRPKGTIDVKNRRCDVEGCEKQAIHRQESGARTCGKHKNVTGLVCRDTTPKGKTKKSKSSAIPPPLALPPKAHVPEGLAFLESLEKAANHVDKQALVESASAGDVRVNNDAVEGANRIKPGQHVQHFQQPEYAMRNGLHYPHHPHHQERMHMNEVTMAGNQHYMRCESNNWLVGQNLSTFQGAYADIPGNLMYGRGSHDMNGSDSAQKSAEEESSKLRLQMFQQQLQFKQKVDELQRLYRAREENILRENQLLKAKISENSTEYDSKISASNTSSTQGNMGIHSITEEWIKQKLDSLSVEIRAEHNAALASSWLPKAAYQLPVVALAAQRLLADVTSICFPQHSYGIPTYGRFGEASRSPSSSFSHAASAETKKKA